MTTFEEAINGSLKKWEDTLETLKTGQCFPRSLARGLRDKCALCGYARDLWYNVHEESGSHCACCPWTGVFKHPCIKGAWYESMNLIQNTDAGAKHLEEILRYMIGCLKIIRDKATG